jgi:hypothetical protein
MLAAALRIHWGEHCCMFQRQVKAWRAVKQIDRQDEMASRTKISPNLKSQPASEYDQGDKLDPRRSRAVAMYAISTPYFEMFDSPLPLPRPLATLLRHHRGAQPVISARHSDPSYFPSRFARQAEQLSTAAPRSASIGQLRST